MRWAIPVFAVLLSLSASILAQEETQGGILPLIMSKVLLSKPYLVFEVANEYFHEQPHEWRIPDGIIEYAGRLEVSLFAYDETVDPILTIGEKAVDERADNFERHILDIGTGSRYDPIVVSSDKSRKFRYYLRCVYRSKAKPLELVAQKDFEKEKRMEDLNRKFGNLRSRGRVKQIDNGTGLWAQLNIVVWLPEETTGNGYKIRSLKDRDDIKLQVYSYDNGSAKLRGTTARGSGYCKFLKLDTCSDKEKFFVTLEIKGSPARPMGNNPECLWTNDSDDVYRMMYAFIPYNEGVGNRPGMVIQISGEFPAIAESSVKQSPWYRPIFDWRRPTFRRRESNIHELPTFGAKRLILYYSDKFGEHKIEEYKIKDSNIWRKHKHEIERPEGSLRATYRNEIEYKFDFKLANARPPSFMKIDGGRRPRLIEGSHEGLKWGNSFDNRVSWWRVESKSEKQTITVVWKKPDIDIDINAYKANGDFVEMAAYSNREKYQKTLILAPGNEYYLSFSLNSEKNSTKGCEYDIVYKIPPSVSGKWPEKLGASSLVGGEIRKLGQGKGTIAGTTLIRIYQKHQGQGKPGIALTMSEVDRQIKQEARFYHNYEVNTEDIENLHITLENISNDEVKYWWLDTPRTEPVLAPDSDSGNDFIWRAERITDLTEGRSCTAQGKLNNSNDRADYWKIRIAEDTIDNIQGQELSVSFEDGDNVRLRVFPDGQESDRGVSISLEDDVYTYYIGVYLGNAGSADYKLVCRITDEDGNISLSSENFKTAEEEIK